MVVPATELPDYEVLVREAREAVAALLPIPPGASETEPLTDHQMRTAIGRAIAAGLTERDKAKLRAVASKALDPWEPAIDELADISQAAEFLRYADPGSVLKRMQRTRQDDTPKWPEPDLQLGRSPGWSYRTLIVHLAMETGRGKPGVPRGPRKKTTAGR